MLLFRDGPPENWQGAAAAIANAVPGLQMGDATRVTRMTTGFVELNLTPEAVASVARALDLAGFPTLTAPTTARVQPPLPLAVQRARLDVDAFVPIHAASAGFEAGPIPWNELRFIHAGGVTSEQLPASGPRGGAAAAGLGVIAASQLMPGPPVVGAVMRSLRDAEPVASRPAPPDMWMDLIAPALGRRIRIRMGAFSYDCLPPPLAPNARLNFPRLVRAVCDAAPHAARSGAVTRILSGPLRPDAEPLVEESVYDRTVCWLLTRERLLST